MTTHNYRGFRIARGSYQGTTDDRLDRWYADPVDADTLDRRGPGHATLADAKAAIDEAIRPRFGGRETLRGGRPVR